eukprot:scaffold62604_cov68-Phaeocystis_antarctica.AAC.5
MTAIHSVSNIHRASASRRMMAKAALITLLFGCSPALAALLAPRCSPGAAYRAFLVGLPC